MKFRNAKINDVEQILIIIKDAQYSLKNNNVTKEQLKNIKTESNENLKKLLEKNQISQEQFDMIKEINHQAHRNVMKKNK